MIFSEQYLDLLRDFEGFYATPYVCTGGACTIGYGTNLEAHPKFIPFADLRNTKLKGRALCNALKSRNMVWDIDKANAAMLDELSSTHASLERQCKPYVILREKQENVRADCLLDMAYNTGIHSLMRFTTTLNFISKGDYINAANNMKASLWYKQVGRRARAVCHMMRTGQYLKPSEIDKIKA